MNGIIKASNENIVNININTFLLQSIHSELLNDDIFAIESKKIVLKLNKFKLFHWKSKENS